MKDPLQVARERLFGLMTLKATPVLAALLLLVPLGSAHADETTPSPSGKSFIVTGDIAHFGTPSGVKSEGSPDDGTYDEEVYGDSFTAKVAGLPAGTYTIEIDLAELFFQGPGQRIMRITSGDTVLADNLDLFATVGFAKAYKLQAKIDHQDDAIHGPLAITFTAIKNKAKFNAIHIFNAAGNEVASVMAGDLTALDHIQSPSVRVIASDYSQVKGPRSDVWRECVGAGRANEGLRADWQRELKLCQDEIGFHSIRFHGLLHDDMGVYSETIDGQPIHNWQYIDELYDYLLSVHIRPFVELSFMPSALASGSKKVFWWNANVSAPKSYPKWDGLIEDLVRHWTERYGVDEVEKWNFEVWNEPNFGGFWGPRDPNKAEEEYFELYAHTVAAIKRVNPTYLVGGPSGAGPNWVSDFLTYCATNKVPVDFISYHAYGLGGGPSGLDEHGDELHYLSGNLHAPADTAEDQRPVIDSSQLPHLPIHITEWSTSYSSRDPIHDAYFCAPYILEQLKHTEEGVASMSYWTFTDIFEENGPAMTPFHGGFGLLNLEGIKKPAYFAYRFLAMLGPVELQNTDPASWVCRDDQGGVQCLFWNLISPMKPNVSDQATFRKIQPAKFAGVVNLRFTNIPPRNYRARFYRVGFEKNDAYTAYLKMGAPSQLSRAQVQQLLDQSSGSPEMEKDVTVDASGTYAVSVNIRTNDVWLVTLKPE